MLVLLGRRKSGQFPKVHYFILLLFNKKSTFSISKQNKTKSSLNVEFKFV